jgi:hypothetical protein
MKKAEIFIPDGSANSIILDRQGKANSGKAESTSKTATFWFLIRKTGYQIKKNDVVIYQ